MTVRLSREELLAAAEIDEETLAELEDYGLITPSARFYDEAALEIARSVGALAAFGLHARHLRAVKAAAEREAGLVEQAVAPLLRRRAPGPSTTPGNRRGRSPGCYYVSTPRCWKGPSAAHSAVDAGPARGCYVECLVS